MHRHHARTRSVLLLALALMLTLGACELADSPDADPSAAQQSDDAADDGIESATDETPAELATDDDQGESDEDPTGEDGAADDGNVIEVEMTEFAYEPATIELTAGEPTVLRFTNVGEIEHEAMIGTAHMQQEFAATDDHGDHGDGGDGHHGDVMAVTVAPGETAELEVLIDEPGTWYVGCHLEGHYDAGMEIEINVTG